MKKAVLVLVALLMSITAFSQDKNLLQYDPCSEDISKSVINKYNKAFSYFQERKYQKASLLLQEIIQEESGFASAYYLMGLIGVNKDNTKMIEKYFPLVVENCKEFSHPYLWYYMGLIDYTDEKYAKAQDDFERFLELTDGNNFYDSLQNEAINYINWSDFLHTVMENPVPFSPKKVDNLAKNLNYSQPTFSWDRNELYFIREEIIRDTNKDSFISSVSARKNWYMEKSTLDDHGYYDRGFIQQEPFNMGKQESRLSFTMDDNTLYYAVKSSAKDNNTWDIYYCEKYDGYWSDAKPVNINTRDFDEMQPCISADGNTLYFVSDRRGGRGGYDIWMCQRESKDSFSSPVNLGRNVNTYFDETYPFLAADNSTMYFLSNGWKTIGGSDVFCARLNSNSQPVNIGYPINTEANDNAIGVMADGVTAYGVFKNSDKGFYEINTFTLPENVRARQITHLNGEVDNENQAEITLRLVNTDSNTLSSFLITPTQKYFSLPIEDKSHYVLYFSQLGYMFSSVTVQPGEKKQILMHIVPMESGAGMALEGIELNDRGTDFTDESIVTLNAFVQFLKTNNRQRIILHADGTLLEPLYDFLTKSGIREDRIEKRQSEGREVLYQIK